MALNNSYLNYPDRSYGMDHQRYDWEMLVNRKKIIWPENKPLALWINVCLEFFPLNQKGEPYPVPGGMKMPYPDLRHYSLRDYGNRVGIYRILAALDHYGFKASFAINGQLSERIPYLMNIIKERKDEVIAYSWNMDTLHYNGMGKEKEKDLIHKSLDTLEKQVGQRPKGWLSPARNESEHTPDLLAEAGISYFCDWVNDDMPYPFKTQAGDLIAMPLSNELDDQFILLNNLHSEESYRDQMVDAADFLEKEAQREGGRILALNIHPWMLGQPHRMAYFEQVLEHLKSKKLWSAYPRELVKYFTAVK